MSSILIVDDEASIRKVLKIFLEKEGYSVSFATKLSETYSILKKKDFKLILLDINLPDGNSLEYLKKIKNLNNNSSIIVMTAQDTMTNAIQAIKNGAYDYITKPFDFDDDFVNTIEKAVKNSIKDNKIERLETDIKKYDSDSFNIIGKSNQMKKVFKDIGRIAESNHTVLILGESGSGKELVSKAIHLSGKNSNKPYIQVNITAIPDDLIESELFGYEKGAFTGASGKKTGRFEEANGGTILLDEIGDMSFDLQSKLLRVLEEKKFYRLGSQKPIKFEARIIASTNKDLENEVKKKNFRQDLYFRLNSIAIELPTLRDRKSDIPLLVDFFLSKYLDKNDSQKVVSNDFITALIEYDWPGNVRELENAIKKIVLMNPDLELDKDSINEFLPKISKKINSNASKVNYKKFIENIFTNNDLPKKDLHKSILGKIEKTLIESVLIKNKGDLSLSSKQLGLTKKTLLSKINNLKISKEITRLS